MEREAWFIPDYLCSSSYHRRASAHNLTLIGTRSSDPTNVFPRPIPPFYVTTSFLSSHCPTFLLSAFFFFSRRRIFTRVHRNVHDARNRGQKWAFDRWVLRLIDREFVDDDSAGLDAGLKSTSDSDSDRIGCFVSRWWYRLEDVGADKRQRDIDLD